MVTWTLWRVAGSLLGPVGGVPISSKRSSRTPCHTETFILFTGQPPPTWLYI